MARASSRRRRPATRQSPRDLRVLKEIAEALNGAADVDRALRESLARVVDLLGLRTGWVWLIDPETGRFYSATARDLPPFLRDPVRMTGRTCWCIDAYRSGELTAENIDVIECSRLRAALGAKRPTRGLRYHATIPLYFGDRRLGIMNVATPRWRRLTRRELDLLSTIASQVGVAVERARLAEESVRLARGEERARLARDLHDTLTQSLTAIGLHIEAAMGAVKDPAGRKQLQQALAVTRSSVDEARHSLHALRGSPLKGRPLTDALVALGREITAETGTRVSVRSSSREPLPSHVEEQMFRIAAEALTNAQRHSKATDVHVTLTLTPRLARLTVVDHGKGFDARAPSLGFGIAGMRERSALIGGRLDVQSRPGGGTRITLTVPRGHGLLQ